MGLIDYLAAMTDTAVLAAPSVESNVMSAYLSIGRRRREGRVNAT
jgi:hypothetical protein